MRCGSIVAAAGFFARRAGGKSGFRDSPNWAVPVLKELLEQKKIEKDASGYFRMVPSTKSEAPEKKWVSPQMKKILERSGKDFTHVIHEDDLEKLDELDGPDKAS